VQANNIHADSTVTQPGLCHLQTCTLTIAGDSVSQYKFQNNTMFHHVHIHIGEPVGCVIKEHNKINVIECAR
jgi:hypothetical protein